LTLLQSINQGTAPAGTDGDTIRTGFSKVNSNTAVLQTQAALSSTTTITAPAALTTSNVGRRTSISLSAAGTINLPAADTCAADQVLFLRNIGSYVVTLAPAAGSGDSVSFTALNPNETVMFETNGTNLWRPLFRSKNAADETVNGNLAVGGTLAATGRVSGITGANLLLNGSAELGNTGWSTVYFSAASDAVGAAGTYFTNTAAVSAHVYDYATPVPVGAGTSVCIQGVVGAAGLTEGSAVIGIEFHNVTTGLNSTTLLSVVSASAASGAAPSLMTATGVAPAGTVAMRFRIGVTSSGTVSGAAGAVTYANLKLEEGTVPSLYSQEASIAYLQGSPAFSGRPTFAGDTPWDSGNLPGSSSGGVFNFTSRPTFSGSVPWDSHNLPSPSFVHTDNKNVISVRWDSSVGGIRCTVDTGYVGSLVNTNSNNSIRLGWTGSVVNLAVDSTTLGAITTSSDYRAKANVRPLAAGAADVVKVLRPVTYAWRDFGPFKADGKEQIGFIAHELQAVIPSAVHGDKDAVDDKGNPQIQSLAWAPIVAVLTKALQEALSRIENLEAATK